MHSSQRRSSPLDVALWALAAAVLLGGCGDDGTAPTTGGETAPAAAAAPGAGEPRIVRASFELPPPEPELLLPTAPPLPSRRGEPPAAASFTRKTPSGGTPDRPAELEIVGLELVYDPADHGAALNPLHERPGLSSLTLKADTVRITGRLHLPQTNVSIYARRLIFEDPPGGVAQIDTTANPHGLPPADAHKTTPGRPGAHGGSAGGVTLIVGELLPTPEPPADTPATDDPRPAHLDIPVGEAMRALRSGAITQAQFNAIVALHRADTAVKDRFVLDGQAGQKGGAGTRGQPGRDAPYRVTYTYNKGKRSEESWDDVVYVEYTGVLRGIEGKKSKGGTKPGNGIHAVAGGRPGNGGDGGDLRTSLPLDQVRLAVTQTAGAAGPPTPGYSGGRAGRPTTWRHIREDGINAWEHDSGTTRAGASVKGYTAAAGKPGELVAADSDAWLLPEIVALRAALAREAYLAGHVEMARQVCVDHLRAVAAGQDHARTDPRSAGQHRDLLTMARRLRSGLDYFGNPPGWAPMLSLEATIDTYRSGIDESIRLLAVRAWAERKWDDLEQRKRSLDAAIALQRGRVEYHTRAHADARKALPRLRTELDDVEAETQAFLALLEAKEKRIADKFQNDEELRELAKNTIAAIKSGIEIAAFSGAGSGGAAVAMGGLTFVERQFVDAKPPEADADSTTAALNAMLAADDQAAARERFLAMGVGDVEDMDAYLAEVENLSKVLAEATRQQIEASVAGGVESGAESRLEDLKAADPDFASYFNQVVELATLKKMLTIKVAEAMERLDRHADAVADARETIVTLAAALDRADALLDGPTRAALATMDRDARERLMRYKYYVVKAWEYRMLRPATVDYRESRLLDKLAALAGDEELAYADEAAMYRDLKAVYEADLNTLIGELVRDLAERRTEAISSTRHLPLSAYELARLNRDGVVEVALDPRVVLPTDRNTRVAAVAVDPAATTIRGSRPGTYLEVTIEPADWSVLMWGDAGYFFQYGLKREASLVRWGFSWNAGGEVTPFDSSGDDAGVLAAAGSDADRTRFRPGARSRLIIRRELHPSDAAAEIASLTLVLTLDKHKAR